MSNLLLFQTNLIFGLMKRFLFICLNRIRIRIWIRIHFESGSRSKTYILVFGVSDPTQVSDPYEVTNLGLGSGSAHCLFFNSSVFWWLQLNSNSGRIPANCPVLSSCIDTQMLHTNCPKVLRIRILDQLYPDHWLGSCPYFGSWSRI